MATTSSGLNALRTIYRHREDAPLATDVSYIVYATLLVLLIVGFPITRTLVILLSSPEMLTVLRAPATEQVVSLAFGAILVLLVAVGSVRGPVLLPPFFVTLLASTSTPLSRTLSRTLASANFFVLAGLLYCGVVVSAVRVFGGGFALFSGIEFVVACVLFAIFASGFWLAGQALGRHAWALVVGMAIVIAGSALVGPILAFTPWGWLGAVWSGDHTWSALALVALTVLAIVSLLLLPVVLNSLSGEALLHQAQRWQAASIAAATGDLATALGRYRAVPRIGRRCKAVGRGGTWVRFLRANTVGAIRTPVRFVGGLAMLTSAFALLSVSLVPGPVPVWLLGATAAGAGYLGCGVLVDGFRYCAVSAGAPPLYPHSAMQQYALHLTFPLLLTTIAALVGFWIAMWFGVPNHALLVGLLVAPLIVVARAFDSAKGAPPLLLMSSPVPTPAGDPTILFLFAWQADALLIVTVSTGVIVSLASTGFIVAAAVISAVVIAGLVLLLRRRLRVS